MLARFKVNETKKEPGTKTRRTTMTETMMIEDNNEDGKDRGMVTEMMSTFEN